MKTRIQLGVKVKPTTELGRDKGKYESDRGSVLSFSSPQQIFITAIIIYKITH